ncbi:hypothetical protein LUZ60_011831 [Juncus effusus]|nr:hypothetical protein LUZ60_011831 [Juncus effusus]
MRTSLLRPLHSLPPPQLPITKRHVSFRPRCTSSNSEEAEPETRGMDLLSGLVGERVEELLKKEENRGLVEKLDEASRRVDKARAELADIKRQREEVRRANENVRQLERQQAEIEESINELEVARAMVDQAEESLSSNLNSEYFSEEGEINRDRERLESVKAGAISSFVGTVASLPIILSQATDLTQVFVHSLVFLISCGLFGVTFRYAVRRDLDDVQLKTGTAAAFGFVKGLATLEAGRTLELSTDGLISFSIEGGIFVAQNCFIFLFAAVALDYCIKTRFLSPFPMKE